MTLKTPAAHALDEQRRLEAERPAREFEAKVQLEVARMLAALAEKETSTSERGSAPQEQSMGSIDTKRPINEQTGGAVREPIPEGNSAGANSDNPNRPKGKQ